MQSLYGTDLVSHNNRSLESTDDTFEIPLVYDRKHDFLIFTDVIKEDLIWTAMKLWTSQDREDLTDCLAVARQVRTTSHHTGGMLDFGTLWLVRVLSDDRYFVRSSFYQSRLTFRVLTRLEGM